MSESVECSLLEQDLILYLYDELPSSRRAAIDGHLSGCERCREVITSMRETLSAVDRARIPQLMASMTRSDWDAEWAALERRLASARSDDGRRRLVFSRVMKAAAVILVAGASFVAGRQWDPSGSLRGRFAPSDGGPGMRGTAGVDGAALSPDSAARMQLFSEQTHGYLDRSRLVLLEFANGRGAASSSTLRDASSNLLRETKSARRAAGQLADRRIEDLLAQVEGILGEISRLSDPDDVTTVNRIRTEVNNSGVLTQLELLSASQTRLAQERS